MAEVTTINVPQADFVTSTLIGAITSASTSFTIGSGLSLDANGGFLQIDYDSVVAVGTDTGPETVAYTAYNSGTGLVSGVTRAQAGTVAVAHNNGTTIQCGMSSKYILNGNKLAYAQIVSAFTTASNTVVQVTGLTVTVIVPAGGRSVKLTVMGTSLANSSSGDSAVISLWDGVVVSGTQIQQQAFDTAAANQEAPICMIAIVTPAAGSKTYNVGLRRSTTGTAALGCSAVAPAFLLAELL